MLRMLAIGCCLLATSCMGPKYVDYFPYNDDGSVKPHVALLPIRDTSSNHLPVNFLEDLTCNLRYQLRNEGLIYLLSDAEMQASDFEVSGINFYTPEHELVRVYGKADFLVLTELVDHNYVPYNSAFPCESFLVIKMRVKVVDLRSRCPRIVLQEIFAESYSTPKSALNDGQELCEDAYWNAAIRKAHAQFTYSLAKRLESVIDSAF